MPIFHQSTVVSIVGAAMMLVACAASGEKIVEDGGAKLNGSELQEIYGDGAKVSWTAASGTSGTGVYGADGSAAISFNSTTWSGTWSIEGDTFCTAYAERDNGAKRCFNSFRRSTGEIAWFNADGSYGGDLTLLE